MSVRELTERWDLLKASDVAQCGEDMDALRALPHEELVRLAWEALNTIEALDEFDYLNGALEDHLEGPGDFRCGWVIAQSGTDFGWNKWSKAVGGYVFNQEAYSAGSGVLRGDALVYFTWDDAKAAFDTMYKDEPQICRCMKIYPVVVSAGVEPRHTAPRRPTV